MVSDLAGDTLASLPELRAARPFRAFGRSLESTRHVAFARIHGALRVVVLTDDVLTVLDLEGHSVDVRAAPFRASERTLVVAGGAALGCGAHVIDLESMTARTVDGVVAAVSPSGRTIAGARRDAVVVWRTGDAGSYAPPVVRGVDVLAVNDDRDVLVADASGVHQYRFSSDEVETRVSLRARSARFVASADGAFVTHATHSKVRRFEVATGRELGSPRTTDIAAIAVGPGGALAVGGHDGTITVAHRDDVLRPSASRPIRSLAFSPDAERLAIGTDRPVITMVSLAARGPVPEPADHDVVAIEIGPPLRVVRADGAALEDGAERLGPDDADGVLEVSRGRELVEVRRAEGRVRWRGARTGELAIHPSDAFTGHAVSPEGVRAVLWRSIPDRARPPSQRLGPLVCIVDLRDGTRTDLRAYGPAAFRDDEHVVAFRVDDAGSAPVLVALPDGRASELDAPRLNAPVRVFCDALRWAVARSDGVTRARSFEPSATTMTIEQRAPSPQNPRSMWPAPPHAMWIEGAAFITLRERLVEIHELGTGALRSRWELAAVPIAPVARGSELVYARQDGSLERLDLETGGRAPVSEHDRA